MTTGSESLLVDTNILLEATDEKRKHHASARTLLETHPRLVLSAQIIREYLVVTTRPIANNGFGMTLPEALGNVREFRRAVRLLPEERPILTVFLDLLAAVPCRGKRIHDAHLVATAMVHHVKKIVSLNADDFRIFAAKVTVVLPTTVLPTMS